MELVWIVSNGDPLKFKEVGKLNAWEFLNLASYMYDRQKTDAKIREASWKK